jgi:hypothetical protein
VDRAAHLVVVDDGLGDVAYWSASYFSETTSTAMWLIAVWATIRWLDSGRRADLLLRRRRARMGIRDAPADDGGACAAVGLRDLRRVRATKGMEDARCAGGPGRRDARARAAVESADARRLALDPYPHYSRVYFPFDKPGFGADPAPPLRPLVPEIAAVGEWSRDLHARYMLSSLPSAFVQRLIAILCWFAEGWRLALGVLILAAALHASGVERAGVAHDRAAVARVSHVRHIRRSGSLYYVEVLPIFYFLAARELGRVVHKFSGLDPKPASAGRRRRPTRRWQSRSCCCRSA